MHINLLTQMSITLFCCGKKVFVNVNTGMIGRNSKKHHYQKNKIFKIHLNMEDIIDADFVKNLILKL